MKQETLEEVKQSAVEWLENYLNLHCNPTFCDIENSDFEILIRQAKEMEKQQQGYSEEEVLDIITKWEQQSSWKEFPEEWFKQFKNK